MASVRNYRNAQGEINVRFGAVREVHDVKFTTLHDALEAAYYQHWKQGLPQPVTLKNLTADVIAGVPTLIRGAASRPLPTLTALQFFNQLHGLLCQLHELLIMRELAALPASARPPRDQWDPDELDDDGVTPQRRSVRLLRRVQAARAAGFDIDDL